MKQCKGFVVRRCWFSITSLLLLDFTFPVFARHSVLNPLPISFCWISYFFPTMHLCPILFNFHCCFACGSEHFFSVGIKFRFNLSFICLCNSLLRERIPQVLVLTRVEAPRLLSSLSGSIARVTCELESAEASMLGSTKGFFFRFLLCFFQSLLDAHDFLLSLCFAFLFCFSTELPDPG